jgi:hypothetical protein
MNAQSLSAIAVLAAAAVVGAALPAAAQSPTPVQSGPSNAAPSGPPRVEVNPRPLLYRRCTSWYVVQHRPSGTVLFPEKHCWWVRG